MHNSAADAEARRLIANARGGNSRFTAFQAEIVDAYYARVENRKHLHALGLTGPGLYAAYVALYVEWEAEGVPDTGQTREALFSIGEAIYRVTGVDDYRGHPLEGEEA